MNSEINYVSPFKKFCITIGNLPTAYLESMSYYEGLTYLVNYLSNNVIPALNNNGEVVEELQQKFTELKNYVDTYFDNLDVQEEINIKLDQMVTDGTLEHIIANYLQTQKIYNTTIEMLADANNLVNGLNVQTLGYYNINDKGGSFYQITNTQSNNYYQIDLENGLYANLILNNKELNIMQLGFSNKNNYDTEFSSLGSIINLLNIEKIVFNNETYNVTSPIVFNLTNKKIIFDFGGGIIKLNANIRYFTQGIFTINMNKDIKSECYLLNGYFDGSGTTPNFESTNVNPNGGMGMFFINGARYINADNLYFHDWFYSECICSRYCSNADITNLTGVNCGGRSADNTEDSRGDALYFGYTGVVYDQNNNIDTTNSQDVNIRVENCSFSSFTAQSNPYNDNDNIRNGCKSGRAGIVFGEYAHTPNTKNLIMNNCYFYNYQRMIHIENVENVNIEVNNTTFENYGEILLLAKDITGNSATFNNCTFNKNVDVIAIHKDYDVLFNGHTTNNLKNIIVNNSVIRDQYGGLVLYCKDINIEFNNCDIEINKLRIENNCYPIFNNSKIKYNRSGIYNSIIKFDNCEITGGFKNDENSKCFLQWTGNTYYNNLNNIINNCKCTNVGTIAGTNKFIITNNEFVYNENFINTDVNETTRDAFFGVYPNKLSKLSNNIITNNYGTIKKLINETTNSDASYQINGNIFYNLILSLYNVTEFKSRIYNNLFKNTNETITNAGDLYNSKAIIFNNQYIGYTNAMINYSNCTQFNNYLSTDGSTNTLIS